VIGRSLRIVAAVAVVLVIFGLGVVVGGHPVDTGLIHLPGPLRGVVLGEGGETLEAEILRLLERDYYREIDPDTLDQVSVEALFAHLGDPYTGYLDPERYAALLELNKGLFTGVGVTVTEAPNGLEIVAVTEGGPASKAGLVAGDHIVSVNGRSIAREDPTTAADRIRGPEGEAVTLGVRSGDGPVRQVELVREELELDVTSARLERSGGRRVGHVALDRFTRGAADALRADVEAMKEQGAEALVLDLRGDPGGLVSEAVAVAGVFLPEGTPVVTIDDRGEDLRRRETEGDPVDAELPLVVLVDHNSASASEIVTGALRDAGRARVVGERTFGKALVQTTEPLRDGGALKLTIARYRTPDGQDISATKGIAPQVRAVDDPDTPADEALRRALAVAARGA
jgi:carboxyl-terminal processing protease